MVKLSCLFFATLRQDDFFVWQGCGQHIGAQKNLNVLQTIMLQTLKK